MSKRFLLVQWSRNRVQVDVQGALNPDEANDLCALLLTAAEQAELDGAR